MTAPLTPGSAGPDQSALPVHTVIGIDLSLTATGLSDGRTTWRVRSTGKADDDLQRRHSRQRRLVMDILDRALLAALVVIEQPAYSRQAGHQHDRSGAWWAVVDALLSAGVAVAEVPPTTLKLYATGRGNADKGAMIESATRRLPDVQTDGDADRADALWLAAAGLDHLDQPLCLLPAVHRAALAKVRWPEVHR